MDKEELKLKYKNACNAFLIAFYNKHGFESCDCHWIADRPGETAAIRDDYFVDMSTITDDIDLDAPEDEFEKWYDYCSEMRFLGAETTPNFRSWVKGCPRKSKEEIEELKQLHQKIDELKNELLKNLNYENF